MASNFLPNHSLFLAFSLLLIFPSSLASGATTTPLTNHRGPLLTGNINLALIWYGRLGRVQKNGIRAFIKSLNYDAKIHPQVSDWWKVVEGYQSAAKLPQRAITVKVVKQVADVNYSVGKVITTDFLKPLVQQATGGNNKVIPVIFTDKDVTVQGLCMGKCALHGVFDKQPYIMVGNPEVECPAACAWPFVRSPEDHANAAPLKPPSGSIGGDAMISAFAQGIAEMVTNPFNSGFFVDGRKPIEAGSACQGIFGSGASHGSAGKVMIDRVRGGAYNAFGSRNMKFLVPAVWNPHTKSCYTLM